MPDASVDCIVTSPPFWSLRDYGTGAWQDGDPTCPHPHDSRRRAGGARCAACGAVWVDPQYGLEPTVQAYVGRLVAVFDQARRVLTPTGTCWLNLGDCFSGGARRGYDTNGRNAVTRRLPGARNASQLPPKNLIGVPWRTAFALQASGWWLRNAIIWSKINPMPESVRDRLSTSYELLFLLTRSHTYYFDLDPIRIPLLRPEALDGTRVVGGTRKGRTGGVGATVRRRGASRYGAPGKYTADEVGVEPRAGRGNLRPVGHAHTAAHPVGRNPGDVWRIATRPYRGAHVAPFPIDLPLRAIAAGCPPGGTVLDPFSGAATTGLAALQLGRSYIGVDVSTAFHDEALNRLRPYLPDRA
jgi:site-specific DNA-methyltransferase (cytosine-N4-specific)